MQGSLLKLLGSLDTTTTTHNGSSHITSSHITSSNITSSKGTKDTGSSSSSSDGGGTCFELCSAVLVMVLRDCLLEQRGGWTMVEALLGLHPLLPKNGT